MSRDEESALDQGAEEKRLAILGEIKAFDLPPLEDGTDAYVSLEASLLQHGCINPVVMNGDENIAGRARKAICDKHGIKYEIVNVDDLSEADLVSLQNDLNFVGRHIDTATKKAYAKQLLIGSKGKLSNRAVASMVVLDPKTVQVVREELEASEEIPHTVKRYSRDGREQDVSDKEVKPTDKDDPDEGEPEEEPEEEEEIEDEAEDGDILPLVETLDDEPEKCPDYVYEVNQDKGTIVRRKVERQRGDKYYLSNGNSLLKCYGHLTWLGAHELLVMAVQQDKEDKEEDIEDLVEKKEKLVADLKNLETQILGATKEIEKLDSRIEKVEQMVPPKGAAAETEEEAA